MIRDPRPVLEQVKSGLRIAGITVVVCASLLVIVSFLPIRRIQAWGWHWKHGNELQAGMFKVPVPNEWYVWQDGTGTTRETQLINTKGGRPFWATITITEEQPPRNIALADLAGSQRRMMENLGIHVMETQQLAIDGVAGFCLDGETAMAGLPVRNISCHFGANFSMEYIGSSLKAPSFYVILDGISRVSRG